MMSLRDIFDLLQQTIREWVREDITRMGAALAYYAAFSLVPLLLVATAVAGTVFSENEVESQVVQRVREFVGEEAGQAARDALQTINSSGETRMITTILSVVGVLIGATGMFRQLKSALNVIWNVPTIYDSKVRGYLKDTVLSVMMVMAMGVFLLLLFVLNNAVFAFVRSLDEVYPTIRFSSLWQLVGGIGLYLATLLTFAAIYRFLPDAHVSWSDVWLGAAVTALLFTIGQFIMRAILGHSTLDTLYGAASAFMLILIWVHITAHLILLGAEFTQVYANRYGNKIRPTHPRIVNARQSQ